MTSISPLTQGYYSLAEQSGSNKAATTRSTATTTSASSTSATGSAASDTVSLSAEAQAYLASMQSPSASSSSFLLSDKQKAQIEAILAKYKDAPFTQDTYEQIQYELQQQGLSPEQLSLQEQIKSFSATQSLLDALNGVDSGEDAFSNLFAKPADETKVNSYLTDIVAQWQKISTTYEEDA